MMMEINRSLNHTWKVTNVVMYCRPILIKKVYIYIYIYIYIIRVIGILVMIRQ